MGYVSWHVDGTIIVVAKKLIQEYEMRYMYRIQTEIEFEKQK